jgi:two-component system OmpR family sensor kinase
MNLNQWSLRSRLTIGIVLLSAIGFGVTFYGTANALNGYLVGQIDNELNSVVGGTAMRLDRGATIQQNEENFEDHHRNRGGMATAAPQPLQRIPTTLSVTLLGKDGAVKGELGGDLTTSQITDYLSKFDNKAAVATDAKPFTIEAPGPDFRALAVVLPTTGDTVVVAQSLEAVEKTKHQLMVLFLLVGLFVLLLIAGAARYVIRIGMRPLENVEKTAEKIAAGDLSARLPDAKPTTEVGRLVSSLNTMLSRIEESFAARTESEGRLRRFVADASHELRTPLTAIRGFAELHRQGAVTGEEQTKELVARIERESMRMSALVEDLLVLARMDQGPKMEIKPVNLSELVTDAVESARAAGPGHPITLVKSDSEDDIYALGDSNRIHQVVANLLANARVHTPVGTSIKVSIAQSEKEVQVVVADNGPGLSEENREKIFERFYRVDPSRQRTGAEGSGLGLSIVDAVMRSHGGHVSVDSKLGEGSTFTLHFPLN